jgi:NMD protein affecting ribosome stability and mRNA decay
MTVTCTNCGDEVDLLAVFPSGICLSCYEKTPEATAPLTADDIVRAWGGK